MIWWGKGKGKELIVSRATIVKVSNQTWWKYMNHNRAMHKDFYSIEEHTVTTLSFWIQLPLFLFLVCERPAKYLIVYRYWHWCIIVLDRTMIDFDADNEDFFDLVA